MANVQAESGQIVFAGSNFPHPILFHSSKEVLDHFVQNCPRSDLDGLVRFWPNASGLEACWCAIIIWPGSGRTQLAHYQFSTFRLLHSSTDAAHAPYRIICTWTAQNRPAETSFSYIMYTACSLLDEQHTIGSLLDEQHTTGSPLGEQYIACSLLDEQHTCSLLGEQHTACSLLDEQS